MYPVLNIPFPIISLYIQRVMLFLGGDFSLSDFVIHRSRLVPRPSRFISSSLFSPFGKRGWAVNYYTLIQYDHLPHIPCVITPKRPDNPSEFLILSNYLQHNFYHLCINKLIRYRKVIPLIGNRNKVKSEGLCR